MSELLQVPSRSPSPAASGIDVAIRNSDISGRDIGSYNITNASTGSVNVYYNRSGELLGQAEIAQWLLTASINYKPVQDRVYSRRNHETGKWFFEATAYRDWVEEKVKNLECVGLPGVGKTSIVSAVIEDLKQSEPPPSGPSIVLYIYCSYDDQDTQTVPIVLANLLSQTITQLDPASEPSPEVSQLHREYAPHGISIPREDKTFSVLKSELSRFTRVYVIVDALDEFSVEDYSNSQELVERLQALDAQLLITSRYPVGFNTSVAATATIPVGVCMEDITIFIRGWIQRHPKVQTCLERSEGLLDDVIETISQKSQGMFLVAEFHLSLISGKKTPGDVRRALNDLPSGLHGTYELTIEKRIRNQSPSVVDCAMRTFAWVLHAQRPLSLQELRHVLAFEAIGGGLVSEDDLLQKEDILSACGGLITFVQDEEGPVRRAQFSHSTMKDFFQQRAKEYFPGARRRITETCLRYLAITAMHIPKDIAQKLMNTVTYEDDNKYGKWANENVFWPFHFTKYAACEWGRHARSIGEDFDQELVHKFFKHPVSPYLAYQPPRLAVAQISPVAGTSPRDYQPLYFAQHGLAGLLGRHLGQKGKKIKLNLDIQDFYGRTPLYFAVSNRRPQVVKMLLEHSANPNHGGHKGCPLSCASAKGYVKIVEMLLKAQADPNTREASRERGRTALRLAIGARHADVVRSLLEGGADANITDERGQTPLCFAAHAGHLDMVEILLEDSHRVDPNKADDNGKTPLTLATEGCHPDIVNLLLKKGADPDLKTTAGTPLCVAAAHGRVKITSMLLHRGADPDAPFNGKSPLQVAVQSGKSEIARVLVEGGANPDKKDRQGETPRETAVQSGQEVVLKMLGPAKKKI